MPDSTEPLRRVEVVLGLLLAAVSFAPWWTDRATGASASAWTGPHFTWLPVLLCLATVAARALPRPGLGERWATAGVAAALLAAGFGWLAHLAQDATSPADDAHRLAWVLQDQAAAAVPGDGQFDVAWGYPAGACLMALLLATFVGTVLRRRPADRQP
jgi:hypothetical protein